MTIIPRTTDTAKLTDAANEADAVLQALSGDPNRRSREGDRLRAAAEQLISQSCPSWCTTGPHVLEDGLAVHVRPVGALGVEVCANERDGVVKAASVYLPIFDDGELTPAMAQQIAADLTAAAAPIDNSGRCGTNICWEGWPATPGGQYVTCARPAGHSGDHHRGSSD